MNTVKEIIELISTTPETSNAWEGFQKIFPPDDAHWITFESCPISSLLDILINKITLLQPRINAYDITVANELSIVGAIFISTLMTITGSLSPERFTDYCERYVNAHGQWADSAKDAFVKALSYSTIEVLKNEVKHENIS